MAGMWNTLSAGLQIVQNKLDHVLESETTGEEKEEVSEYIVMLYQTFLPQRLVLRKGKDGIQTHQVPCAVSGCQVDICSHGSLRSRLIPNHQAIEQSVNRFFHVNQMSP